MFLIIRHMRVTILQHDITWANPSENIRHIDELISRLPETDLIVLPEMFSTGFVMEPENIAEGSESLSLRYMKSTAAARGCAIAGSVATETDGRYVNRFYFVTPVGQVVFYDKHHLFTYSGEDKHYVAGSQRVVTTYRGVRIRLLVCYDLRFPMWCRNTGDYDLALFVASWPQSRVDAWDTLLRARAIENQCYVAGVNRIGSDPACHYCGSSAIIDPYGHVIATCPHNVESSATADIDMDKLTSFRDKFPVLKDADKIF